MAEQRPSFWVEFGGRLGMAMLLLAWRYVSKRMPPEEEAAWHKAERRGRGRQSHIKCKSVTQFWSGFIESIFSSSSL
jgi:hypothetical protein